MTVKKRWNETDAQAAERGQRVREKLREIIPTPIDSDLDAIIASLGKELEANDNFTEAHVAHFVSAQRRVIESVRATQAPSGAIAAAFPSNAVADDDDWIEALVE